ncbi:MAG: thioredoxin-disulfide reductase [Rickettsiales bacterium]|nr:thioredoxin-disulfide reductase [Rickettsiales bacterium]
MKKTKCLILGSGPAGLTAAIYAARAALEPILITGITPGGQLTLTTVIENYPGFVEPMDGNQLMQQMTDQAKRLDVDIVNDHVIEVKLNSRPFVCITQNNTKYTCDTLIIATGAQSRWLEIPSEEKFKGHGVSSCATCDGFFYKNKKVAIVGGGNVAVEDALYLANFANQVTLIHRRDELRAEKMLQKKLFANKKIKIIWDSVVEEILGDENPSNVTGLKIKNVKNDKLTTLSLDGVFIAIGHTPNTTMFKDFIKLDKDGYIITPPNSTKTNIEGVFAAGDVQDKIYRQAVTAAGSGCMAALEAEKYLSMLN